MAYNDSMRFGLLLLMAVVLLAATGCEVNIDAPQTPTVPVSPTLDETGIARWATRTPTHTLTPTPIPSFSPTVTGTVSPTHTTTPTLTQTPSPTATPTQPATFTPRATLTRTSIPTPTATASGTPTSTPTVTATPTDPPSMTPAPLPSPTPTVALPAVPSATRRPTQTFTPFPSITPDLLGTEQARTAVALAVSPTRTPGGIYTLTPVPTTATPPPTLTPAQTNTPARPANNATFHDPYAAPGTQAALPVAPPGESGPAGSAPSLPEQNAVVVSYAGQVVPLLDLSGAGGATTAPLAQGDVFAVSQTGQVAAVGPDDELYVNGAPMLISPASRFGLPPNLSVSDLAWSPDGHRLTFRIDAANQGAQNAINAGVWVYEPGSERSWQVLRTTHESQVAQLHEQQQPTLVQWSPDGAGLTITVDTPLGRGHVVVSPFRDLNDPANSATLEPLPFEYASWSMDSRAVIVSGQHWDGQAVAGRVALNDDWTYTEYLNQATTGLIAQAAIELPDHRVAFLGSRAAESFALYVMWPGQPPEQVSPILDGRVIRAEWNPERTAALVTAQVGSAYRLWIVRTDGRAQDSTPAAGVPTSAHWR